MFMVMVMIMIPTGIFFSGSTTRFTKIAAAAAAVFNFYPVVAYEQS
jgi:hypothetical protein